MKHAMIVILFVSGLSAQTKCINEVRLMPTGECKSERKLFQMEGPTRVELILEKLEKRRKKTNPKSLAGKELDVVIDIINKTN